MTGRQSNSILRVVMPILVSLFTNVQAQCSGVAMTIQASLHHSRILNSPGYPVAYTNYLQCSWLIDAGDSPTTGRILLLNSVSVDLEASYDFLNIYDGSTTMDTLLGSYTSYSQTDLLISSGRYLLVNFMTDSSVTFPGFSLAVFAFDTSASNSTTTPSCGTTLLSSTGTAYQLASPGFPSPFDPSSSCWWRIQTSSIGTIIGIRAVFADLEQGNNCNRDWVRIYDGDSSSSNLIGDFCDEMTSFETRTFYSTGTFVYVDFRSRRSDVVSHSFVISYYELDPAVVTTTSQPTTPPPVFNSCAGTRITVAEGETGIITSPNWPLPYENDLYCIWTIAAPPGKNVEIVFDDFELEYTSSCSYDYVQLFNGPSIQFASIATLCQPTNTNYSSGGQSITILFRTDSSITFRGFQLTYSVSQSDGLPTCAVTTGGLMASDSEQYFQSPNYPSDYPNDVNQTYLIEKLEETDTVTIKFLNFELEYEDTCSYDYVRIYDGACTTSPLIVTLCGEHTGYELVHSTGNHILIVFVTDHNVVYSGFRASYVMGDVSEDNEKKEGGIEPWIIGVIIAAVFILIFLIIFCVCLNINRTGVGPSKQEQRITQPQPMYTKTSQPVHAKPKSKRGIRKQPPPSEYELYFIANPVLPPPYPGTPGSAPSATHLPYIKPALPTEIDTTEGTGNAFTDPDVGPTGPTPNFGFSPSLAGAFPVVETGIGGISSAPQTPEIHPAPSNDTLLTSPGLLPSVELVSHEAHKANDTEHIPEAFEYS